MSATRKQESSDSGKEDFVVELRSFEFWRGVIAECVGAYFLLFITCSIGYSESKSLLEKAVPLGLTIIFLTFVFLPVSGAHLNPGITFSMLILRKISPVRTLLYVVAQCGGAISGCGTALGVLNSKIITSPSEISDLGPEFILTFILSIVYYHSINQTQFEAAVMIGLTHTAVFSSIDTFLNPLMGFGPAFLLNQFMNHWVIWLGPILGFLFGGACYKYIFEVFPDKEEGLDTSQGEHKKFYNEDEEDPMMMKPLKNQVMPRNSVQNLANLDCSLPDLTRAAADTTTSSLGRKKKMFSSPQYRRTKAFHKKRMDHCYLNYDQEKSLTDDELQRTTRRFKPFLRETLNDRNSGSSSGYYSASWDRPESYDTEDDLFTKEVFNESVGKYKVAQSRRRQKIKMEKVPSVNRNPMFERSISTSY